MGGCLKRGGETIGMETEAFCRYIYVVYTEGVCVFGALAVSSGVWERGCYGAGNVGELECGVGEGCCGRGSC